MEKVGKRLREKYDYFLPKLYDKTKIKIRFSYIQRTLLSLLSLLNGMFPDLYPAQTDNLYDENDLMKPLKDLGFSIDLKDYKGKTDYIFRATSEASCKLVGHF